MDKKSIAMLLIASCVTSSVFASNIFHKLTANKRLATTAAVKPHKSIKQTNHSFTDFSGTWIIDCGDGPMGSTVIENDAHYISLDGYELRIGKGLQGNTEANEESANFEHQSVEWNTDGSALIVKEVGVSKNHVDNSPIETEIGTFTLTKKNDQINMDGKLVLAEDVAQSDPIALHCVFTKKQ